MFATYIAFATAIPFSARAGGLECGGYPAILLTYVGLAKVSTMTFSDNVYMPISQLGIRLTPDASEQFRTFNWRLGGKVAKITICLNGGNIGNLNAIKEILPASNILSIVISNWDRDEIEADIRSNKQLVVGSDGAPQRQ